MLSSEMNELIPHVIENLYFANGWGSAWDVYLLKASEGSTSDQYKLHISVDRSRFQEAKNLILPILSNRRIYQFKILKDRYLERTDNTLGKEFVIYMQRHLEGQEQDANFWNDLIIEIIEALRTADINPGKPSLADLPLAIGEGYAYTRQSYNIFNKYVKAEDLQESCFTRNEAARLTNNDFFELKSVEASNVQIEEGIPHEAVLPKEINFFLLMAIKNEYSSNIESFREGKYLDSMPNDVRDLMDDIILFSKSSRYIDNELKKAAKITARIFTMLAGIKGADNLPFANNGWYGNDRSRMEEKLPGNIYPIYYHYLLKPIAESVGLEIIRDADKETDPAILHEVKDKFKKRFLENPFMTENARQNFINEIVKCSLRDSNQSQIQEDAPKYLFGLSEEEVNQLVAKGQRFVNPISVVTSIASPTIAAEDSEAKDIEQQFYMIKVTPIHSSYTSTDSENDEEAHRENFAQQHPLPDDVPQPSENLGYLRENQETQAVIEQVPAVKVIVEQAPAMLSPTMQAAIEKVPPLQIRVEQPSAVQAVARTPISHANTDIVKDDALIIPPFMPQNMGTKMIGNISCRAKIDFDKDSPDKYWQPSLPILYPVYLTAITVGIIVCSVLLWQLGAFTAIHAAITLPSITITQNMISTNILAYTAPSIAIGLAL